jgi:excisionase family DNA binding protein
MDDQQHELVTVDQVAAFLKAGKRTVYWLAANGTILALTLGGTWRFRRADLKAWIDSMIASGGSRIVKGATD